MKIASTCLICGALIPLKGGDDVRIACDKCITKSGIPIANTKHSSGQAVESPISPQGSVEASDAWAIRQLFDLPESGELFDQLGEWLEHKIVGDVRIQNCVTNLLAEPVYEGKKKENGIAVRFLMRLHLLAHEVGIEQYGDSSPVVIEALAALGDPAQNSPEALAAASRRHAQSSADRAEAMRHSSGEFDGESDLP